MWRRMEDERRGRALDKVIVGLHLTRAPRSLHEMAVGTAPIYQQSSRLDTLRPTRPGVRFCAGARPRDDHADFERQ
jgi:hypothetical protein